jgi:hypothetical protein
MILPWEIRRGRGTFCSRACGYAHRQPAPIEERFWQNVEQSSDPNGCWIWTGHTSSGYGSLYDPEKRNQIGAHRVSWQIHHGPIPHGLWVLHNCPTGDNPRCVNPAHLWLGTVEDNVADMVAKGRNAHGKHWRNDK